MESEVCCGLMEWTSLFLALTPSETRLEQSQREGRHRSLRAGTAEKDHCVRVSPSGVISISELPWASPSLLVSLGPFDTLTADHLLKTSTVVPWAAGHLGNWCTKGCFTDSIHFCS